jgi:hypothetical protein
MSQGQLWTVRWIDAGGNFCQQELHNKNAAKHNTILLLREGLSAEFQDSLSGFFYGVTMTSNGTLQAHRHRTSYFPHH